MSRFPALAAAVALLSQTAAAQVVNVQPGLWDWSARGVLGFVPLNDTGRDCVAQDEAVFDLQGLADGLNNACTVADFQPTTQGARFVLTCAGDIQGALDAELQQTRDTARLTARGEALMNGLSLPVSLTATASRAGAC